MRRRERHGRGLRGPLATANPFTGVPVPLRRSTRGAGYFAECVRASVSRTQKSCPRALVGIDIGFEEVPSNLGGWQSTRVPLAAAVPAHAGVNARIILFRRPLEHRATSPRDLRSLVHRALLEQLAALTGIAVDELDPDVEPEEWD